MLLRAIKSTPKSKLFYFYLYGHSKVVGEHIHLNYPRSLTTGFFLFERRRECPVQLTKIDKNIEKSHHWSAPKKKDNI